MSEAAVDTQATPDPEATTARASEQAEARPDPEALRAADRANLKRNARTHFLMVMAAITLFGAADTWASVSGLGLAHLVAGINAIIAGVIISSIAHEWLHLAGARLSGAVSPALEKPVKYFFMFDFKFDENDNRQFVWMSWGGIVAPWLLALLTLIALPIDSVGRAVLLATFLTTAVQVTLFEVPVTLRAAAGGDPRKELGRELKEGGLKTAERRGLIVGLAVGAILLLTL